MKKRGILFLVIVLVSLISFSVYGAKVLTTNLDSEKNYNEANDIPLVEIPVTTCSGSGELYLYQQDPFQDASTSFTTNRNQLLIFTRFNGDLDVKVNGINVTLSVILEENSPFNVKVFSLDTSPGDYIEIIGSKIEGNNLIPARRIQGYLTQNIENPVFDINSMEIIYDDFMEDLMYLVPGEYNYVIFDKYSENAPGQGPDNRFLNVNIENPLSLLIVDETYTHPYPSPVEGVVVGSFVTNVTGYHTLSIDTEDSVYWMAIECPETPNDYCGDGILQNDEECDDGNNLDGDGCSAECDFEDEYDCEDLEQQEGLFGKYYNYLSSHPDMELPSSEWPDNGHGDPEGSFDTDWYENQYFRFLRVDNNLEFGNNFFPFDMGAEEITEGHEFHFGAHWEGQIFVPVNGNYKFEIKSDDDAWVYIDGNLVLDDGGIHAATYKNTSVALNAGVYPLDVYFAERHTKLSYLDFDFDDRLIVRPIPDECDECGNGVLDEGEQCEIGYLEGETCGSDVGECEEGQRTRECNQFCEWDDWGECEGDVGPEEEVCDELDNDCDAEIDEELQCEGECGNGVLDEGEQCDDGNLNDFDGCDRFCRLEEVCIDEAPIDGRLKEDGFKAFVDNIVNLMSGKSFSFSRGDNLGAGIGIDVDVEEFIPRIWMDPDSRKIFSSNLNGGGYLNRMNNYAFEGEKISWEVLVWDKNGIEKIEDVFVTLDDDIEANCNWLFDVEDNTTIDRFTPREGEENLYCLDTDTMAVFKCVLTVETPYSMHGEYWVAPKVCDLDGGCSTVDEKEYWFFNPSLGITVDGSWLEFGEQRPGTSMYSQTTYVGNGAEFGSGVIMNMTISGTNFYDSDSSGAKCPTSNVLRLENFRYFATNGYYDTFGNYGSDAEGYDSIPYETSSSAKRAAILDNEGNLLTPGSEMAMTFRLNLPEPCNGNFDSGSIYFWGEAI